MFVTKIGMCSLSFQKQSYNRNYIVTLHDYLQSGLTRSCGGHGDCQKGVVRRLVVVSRACEDDGITGKDFLCRRDDCDAAAVGGLVSKGGTGHSGARNGVGAIVKAGDAQLDKRLQKMYSCSCALI